MGLFELNIPEAQTNLPQENTLRDKSAAKALQLIDSHAKKVATIKANIPDIPKEKECIFVWTTNQFNTVSFLLWIIEHTGPIQELTLSTYSIGANCINALVKLMDTGQILKSHLYVSTYMQRINAKCVDLLRSYASSRPLLSIGYGFNHSKILLATTQAGHHLVITGSGNFAENARNEQYTICNDKRIYDFYYSCIREDNPDAGTERGTDEVR